MLVVCNLQHPSCYKRWRATLIALMSSASCSQPSHNEICSRRNRPERLGRTLRHMAETAVISMAGGWMLQIGKRLSHPEPWPWWRVLEKEPPERTAAFSVRLLMCNIYVAAEQLELEQSRICLLLAMINVDHSDCFMWSRGGTQLKKGN